MIESITCNRCGLVDDYTATFNTNNNSVKAECNSCGRYIKFVKYDDDDFKAAVAEVYKWMGIKKGLNDMEVDCVKMVSMFPKVLPLALVERIKKEWPEFNFKETTCR